MKLTGKNSKLLRILIAIGLLILPILLEWGMMGKIELTKASLIRMGFIYGVYVLMVIYHFLSKAKERIKIITDFIIRYRYAIAGIFFIILVGLKINFSSISMWADFIGEPGFKNEIIGEAKSIRSDEWLTQTPFMLSQMVDNADKGMYNPNVAQGNMNMLMVTAPVWDIVSIARPLTWGLLFLGSEYGFSFYWVAKMIALIMVSIEILLKITKRDSLLSLTGGILLGLAPAMMWWLSTAVVDGYLYGMAIIILFSYYMEHLDWKLRKKIAISIGMLICIPAFVFVLYPAFQVPFAFFMLVFLITDLIKHRKELKKQDYVIMGITLLGAMAIIARFVLLCWNDIQIMMQTVYPGSRFETGGNFTTGGFIAYLANLFFPYSNQYGNTCEPSSYIYPFIGLIILIIMYLKPKNNIKAEKSSTNRPLILALIILYGVFLLWEFVGFNHLLAKITLLYFSPVQRTHVVLGIIGTILLIALFPKGEAKKRFTKTQSAIISVMAVVVSYVLIKESSYATFFTPIKLEIAGTLLLAMTYFLLRGEKGKWCYTMCIIAIVAGALVNPVARGIGVITKTELAKEIQEISHQDQEAIWLGRHNLNGQYLIANGAKCLNGVNTYPNFEWLKTVDPEGTYNEIYNRFAHISIILGDKTEFRLLAQDSYEAELTYEDLKKLNVSYYFTNTEASEEEKQKFQLTDKYVVKEKNQYIYEIH